MNARFGSEFMGERCDGDNGVGVMNGVVFGVVGIPNVLADDPWVAKPCATASKFSRLSLTNKHS